ncbi:hypothetical protein BH09BAC1_BH09BAC1_24180 [soil metagenome]
MKKVFPIIAFGIVIAFCTTMHSGCYYDNEDDLYPFKGVCDTSTTPLAAVVKPIIMGNCYSCHSASSSGGLGAGINLEDYGSLKGYADNGKLVCSIEHTNGCSAMPKGTAKLPDCQIAQIKAWVGRGAQNN